jgi:hypothetical protein
MDSIWLSWRSPVLAYYSVVRLVVICLPSSRRISSRPLVRTFFFTVTFFLLRLLERCTLREAHSVLVNKRSAQICRIHRHRQRKRGTEKHVGGAGCEAHLLTARPPVVNGSNESNVVEQSVHGADLRLLG